jgi:hypothetical protein
MRECYRACPAAGKSGRQMRSPIRTFSLTQRYVAISVRSVYFLCKNAKAPIPDMIHIMATR